MALNHVEGRLHECLTSVKSARTIEKEFWVSRAHGGG